MIINRGTEFCHLHSDRISPGSAFASAAGALTGNLLFPGLGGLIGGALAGFLVCSGIISSNRERFKVFISFDYEDVALKNLIVGQSKHPESQFEIVDHSLREAAPEKHWKVKANRSISQSDVMLVILGPNTYMARGVISEIRMAKELNVAIYQIIGYRNIVCRSIRGAGRVFDWDRDNLRDLLS